MAILSSRRGIAEPDLSAPSTSPSELSLFPTSGPLSAERLIGRTKEISGLVEALTRGEHQVLSGPAKAGKTSVAAAAVATLEGEGWLSTAIDLFHTRDLAALSEGLAESASRLAQDVDPATGLSESDSSFPGQESAPRPQGETRARSVTDAVELLQRVADGDDRRIVLFIDEFQEIATTQLFGKPDQLMKEMRSVLDGATRVVCLFVGSVPYRMRELFTSKDEPFYKFGSFASLPLIPWISWRAGLYSRFMEAGYEIDDFGVRRLIQLGADHPHAVMLIAQRTLACARTSGTRRIDKALVEEGFRAALSAERAVHELELARLRTLGKHALGTALRVASGDAPYKKLPPAIARQTLRSLETAGVVVHPQARTWRIVDPLFREYLLSSIDKTSVTPAADSGTADHAEDSGAEESSSAALPAHASVSDGQAATTMPSDMPFERGHLSFRHPSPEEAEAVGRAVGHVFAFRGDGRRDRATSGGKETTGSDQSRRRFGRFLKRTVEHHPEWYWQLEADGQPVAGLVLYRPRAVIGQETSSGIDPLLQLGVLALVVALAVAGIVVLVLKDAWTWGWPGDLLLGAFGVCLAQALILSKGLLGRGRASWIARRHGGAVLEGLWSEPGVLPSVFEALARELPGTLVAAHAETSNLLSAYGTVGFWAGAFGVVAGVLDPTSNAPVHAATFRARRRRGGPPPLLPPGRG